MPAIYPLQGVVKQYDWGGYSYIPGLLALDNRDQQPFAEYWLGVHVLGTGQIVQEYKTRPLSSLIEEDAHNVLGQAVFHRFRQLPYLLKVLDVRQMLSIQVHPTKFAAETGHSRENAAGVMAQDPKRNYKDDNHKPELLLALNEFWLLHGFKPATSLLRTLQDIQELHSLIPVFEEHGYQGLYRTVMEMPQQEVNDQLESLLERIVPLYQSHQLAKSDPSFWAARAALTFPGPTIDRGIFSIYFFNLVRLAPGEAMFQDAGIPHAYLEGLNIEIMANSDNVLRGGLTSKHIDVPELLLHTKFEPTHPDILKGGQEGHGIVYKTPAPDFELSRFELEPGETIELKTNTVEIFLLISGEITISNAAPPILLKAGQPAAVASANTPVRFDCLSKAVFFRAAVPAGE